MGYWKEKLIELMDRGFGETNAFICANCIGDSYVQNIIKSQGEIGNCSFCKNKFGKPLKRKVISLEVLMYKIKSYLYEYYLDAESWGGYDSETKDFTFATYDSDDIASLIACELEIENQDLVDEISRLLTDELLVKSSSIWLPYYKEMYYKWEKFCENVRNLNKYSVEQIVGLCDRENAPDCLKEISDCMYMVLDNCEKINLVESLTPNDKVFRGVKYKNYPMGFDYYPASFIGTPPAIKVKSNRMSEERDMMFYGSLDKRIVIREIEYDSDNESDIVIGTFSVNKKIFILDLAEIYKQKRPSVLDIENKDILDSWYFIEKFIDDISMPINDELYINLNEEIKKDSSYSKINELKMKIDIEYKPSQVFTKFIQRKTKFKGISFKSSKSFDSFESEKSMNYKNYVLFVPNCDCIDKCDEIDLNKTQLIMEPNVEIVKKINVDYNI